MTEWFVKNDDTKPFSLDSSMDAQSVVRTEWQLKPHEGPTGIRPADRKFASDSRYHTPRLAVPAEWTKQAKCLDDWKAFAPEGDGTREPTKEVAEQLCVGCPVLELCLSAAMEEEGTSQYAFRGGIRGGLTPTARYKLSKGMAVPAGTPCCHAGHPRAEFGYWDKTRWRCDECIRVKSALMETCSCGRTMRRNTLYTHRRRHGCLKVSTPERVREPHETEEDVKA